MAPRLPQPRASAAHRLLAVGLMCCLVPGWARSLPSNPEEGVGGAQGGATLHAGAVGAGTGGAPALPAPGPAAAPAAPVASPHTWAYSLPAPVLDRGLFNTFCSKNLTQPLAAAQQGRPLRIGLLGGSFSMPSVSGQTPCMHAQRPAPGLLCMRRAKGCCASEQTSTLTACPLPSLCMRTLLSAPSAGHCPC